MSNHYLVDTNVVSEMTKIVPNDAVVQWLAGGPSLYLSVLTVGEIQRGITRLSQEQHQKKLQISSWLKQLCNQYSDRIFNVDMKIVQAWGKLPRLRTYPVIDSLLAATAIAYDLILVTRNVSDFEGLPVRLFNPFADL